MKKILAVLTSMLMLGSCQLRNENLTSQELKELYRNCYFSSETLVGYESKIANNCEKHKDEYCYIVTYYTTLNAYVLHAYYEANNLIADTLLCGKK